MTASISYQGQLVDTNAVSQALVEYTKGSTIPGDKIWLKLVSCEKGIRLDIKHTIDMVLCEKVRACFGEDVYRFRDVVAFLHHPEMEKLFLLRNRDAEDKLNNSIKNYNAKCHSESSKITEKVVRVTIALLSPTQPFPDEVGDEGIPEQFKPFVEEARRFVTRGELSDPLYEDPTRVEILNDIKRVLINPKFQNDPLDFMMDWAIARGTESDFRIVEDNTRKFFNEEKCRRLSIIETLVEYRPDTTHIEDEDIDQRIPDELKPLYRQAKKFISDMDRKGSFASKKDKDAVKIDALNQINEVLKNPGFQEDPIKFMEDWKIERSSHVDYRPTDDSALLFFSTNSSIQSLSGIHSASNLDSI